MFETLKIILKEINNLAITALVIVLSIIYLYMIACSAPLPVYIQCLCECQFITVCNMFILIKCIVCVEINQYQIESPLVLSHKLETTPWTGSSEVS